MCHWSRRRDSSIDHAHFRILASSQSSWLTCPYQCANDQCRSWLWRHLISRYGLDMWSSCSWLSCFSHHLHGGKRDIYGHHEEKRTSCGPHLRRKSGGLRSFQHICQTELSMSHFYVWSETTAVARSWGSSQFLFRRSSLWDCNSAGMQLALSILSWAEPGCPLEQLRCQSWMSWANSCHCVYQRLTCVAFFAG